MLKIIAPPESLSYYGFYFVVLGDSGRQVAAYMYPRDIQPSAQPMITGDAATNFMGWNYVVINDTGGDPDLSLWENAVAAFMTSEDAEAYVAAHGGNTQPATPVTPRPT